MIEYRNFELGVLFHSSSERGIEYRTYTPSCPVHIDPHHVIDPRIPDVVADSPILLPVPYDMIGGKQYYCTESATFLHRPYFNSTEEVYTSVLPIYCYTNIL